MSVKDVTYTPLTKSQARILVEAFNKEILGVPPLTNSHTQANCTKQCRYHQYYGHSKQEWIVLKDTIAQLVQRGCINDFFGGKNYNRGSYKGDKGGHRGSFRGRYVGGWGNNNQHPIGEDEQENPPCAVRGVINTIVGEGCTSSIWKRHLQALKSVNAIRT